MSAWACTRRDFIEGGGVAAGLFSSSRLLAQPSDLTELTIEDASERIRSGSVSPVELVRAYLERIARLDPQLNAFITVTEELAYEQASARESELVAGQWRGPLHGIPVALKDNIDTAGVLTTGGSELFANRVPGEDAEVVRRLKEAGAVLLGKLNMHEFAYGSSSVVSHYGPVRNPWDLDRIAGGSSGGPAAAVAANLCAAALGTDTGGSIRVPAAYCGITGLKPTHGLASIRGIIPLSPSRDHVGPMCRTVADSALMLQVLAGYDPGDTKSIEADIPDYFSALSQPVSSFRLGVPRTGFYEELDDDIREATDNALSVLAELVREIREVELPTFSGAGVLIGVESYAYHAEYLETEANHSLYQPETLEALLSGSDIPATAYYEAREGLERVRREIATVFSEVDLLITPTSPELPITIPEEMERPPADGPDFRLRNIAPFNSFGIPSITIPCGFSRGGLPIGIQISGPRLSEFSVLAVAHAYEQATNWHNLQPPV